MGAWAVLVNLLKSILLLSPLSYGWRDNSGQRCLTLQPTGTLWR
ncbi:hypothetical protein [Nostoc sp. TCL240-02]|nr:hypothetical protein [Nostoc sp. TCL240-02]